jgi:hypothetical protein
MRLVTHNDEVNFLLLEFQKSVAFVRLYKKQRGMVEPYHLEQARKVRNQIKALLPHVGWVRFNLIGYDVEFVPQLNRYEIHNLSSGWVTANLTPKQMLGLLIGGVDICKLDWY